MVRALASAIAVLGGLANGWAASAAEPDILFTRAHTSLAEALRDRASATFGLQLPAWPSAPGDGTSLLDLPEEDPDHPLGVYWATELHVGVDIRRGAPGIRCLSGSRVRVLLRPDSLLDAAATRAVAEAFTKAHFQWWFERPGVSGPYQSNAFGVGGVAWIWRSTTPDGIVDGDVEVVVRLVDGKVTAFDASNTVYVPEHRYSPAEARAKAAEQVRSSATQLGITEVEERSWFLGGNMELGRCAYSVVYRGKRADGRAVEAAVHLDPMDGTLLAQVLWRPVRSRAQPVAPRTLTGWPAWSADGLLATGTDLPDGLPSWASSGWQTLRRGRTGKWACLTSDAEAQAGRTAASPNGHVVTVERSNDRCGSFGWAINTLTGQSRLVATPVAGASHTCPSPDGRWVVSEWEGREHRPDLFADDLTRASILPTRRGRISIPGVQDLPCFSPDGKLVYFVDLQEPYHQQPMRLVRLPSEKILKIDLVKLPPSDEEVICEVPKSGKRLSITPNGARLILQADDGMYLLSVPEKSSRKLDLGPLIDPDLKVPVVDLIDAWAGPGDDKVTFSGKTTDADQKVRRRIYCCRFDGSELEALTPAENTPVPMYVFPETGKTALEVAKEWALEEVYFERRWKAQREREAR